MDKPFKGPSRTEEFYLVPKEIIEDLTLTDSAVRLYAIIKKRTVGEQEIPTHELAKATGQSRSRIKALKAEIGKRGFMQRAYDHYGKPYWSAIFNLDNVRRDTDLFLSVSTVFNQVAGSKSFLLLKAKEDPERFLVAMEKLEWDYQGKTVNNPVGLLKFYLEKVDKAKNGFHRGWWKVRVSQKEARKEADRIAKKASAEIEKEREKQKSFEKYLSSLTKEQVKVLENKAIEHLKANGGIPKFGANRMIRIEMRKIWEGTKHASA